jgi:branched-chain amino acid transport system permease protein
VDKFLIFTIVGLSLAAIYAVIASGLVLTYTTTGIFNFAHGAIGMLAAFMYWQLRFDWGWPTWLSVLVVLFVAAPIFGFFLEATIMRRLVGTSEATKLVVSISLLIGLIGLANLIWSPGESRPMGKFFESHKPIDLGVTTITYHQAITMGTAIVVAVGLRFLLYRTRMGVSMRANVDDRTLAVLNGAQPDRIAMLSWAVGCSLAAVGGILIAPSLTLEPISLSLLIVNAYAAAIFGRLRSLPLTFLGAIIVGLTEGYLVGYLPGDNQYLASLRPAAAVIILFIALLVVPNPRLRTRTQLREWFPPPSASGLLLLGGFVIAAGFVLITTVDATSQITYGQIFSLGIVALSLVPLVGYAGQISLAQLTFGGIGAVAAGHHMAGGNPVGILVGVLVAALVGGLVALPVVRLSGIYLALATAAFGVALDRWIFNLPDFDIGPVHFSIFQLGSTNVPPLKLFGYEFDTPSRTLMLAAVAFAIVAGLVGGLRFTRLGRQLVAMRDSEAACATFGLNLLWPRLAVFMVSAGIAGLGGAIYGMQLGAVSPERFNLVAGLPIFVLVVVGGAGLVGAALFAGVSLYGLLPLTAALGAFVAKINTVTPGLTGVGLGRNPSGVVPLMQEGVAPIRRDRPVLIGAIGAAVVVYVLRRLDVYGNWPFVILLFLCLAVGNEVARRRLIKKDPAAVPDKPPELEWVGITTPWTPERLVEVEEALQLDSFASAVSYDGEANRVPS